MKCCVQSWLGSGSVLVLIAAVVLSGCGGGGDVPGTKGSISPPTVSGIDKAPDIEYGNSVTTAHHIFPDNGRITGAINFGGDVDMFRVDCATGVTYGLQFLGMPVAPPDSGFFQVVIQVREPDGVTPVPLNTDAPILLPGDPGESRVFWTSPSNKSVFVRISHALVLSGTGNYAFNLMSTQESGVFFQEDNLFPFPTKPLLLRDPDDPSITLYDSVISGGVGGLFGVDFFNPGLQPDFLPVWQYTFLVTPVIFDADPTADPETPAVHIHFGTPDNTDGIPGSPRGVWPNESNFNFQPATPDLPHPFLLDITPTLGTTTLFREMSLEEWHLIGSHQIYFDVHLTDDFELFPAPVMSSRANGTFNNFETTLPMLGANVVPPVASVNFLELKYNTAFQTFMIEFDRPETTPAPDPDLVGATIHVHTGGPGTNGPILIDLGVIPAPIADPVLETVPWIKNPVKELTNTEAFLLRQATYTTGWYVDVHTPAFPNGELRAEGFLGIATDPRSLAPAPN